MTSKVIFLDIDGPMIPLRAALLPEQTHIYTLFDPVASSIVNTLIREFGAQLVISSTIRMKGYANMVSLLGKNGFSESCLHVDWRTPIDPYLTRSQEIATWLQEHQETTHYVAIDDEILSVSLVPHAVQCCTYEGLSFRNYLECCLFLAGDNIDVPMRRDRVVSLIAFLKQKEILRTKRLDGDERKQFEQTAIEILQ